MVKNLPATRETWIRSLGWEGPLEKAMATHSSIIVRKIPMDRRALAGYSPWSRKESDMMEPLSIAQFSRSSSLFLRVNFY